MRTLGPGPLRFPAVRTGALPALLALLALTAGCPADEASEPGSPPRLELAPPAPSPVAEAVVPDAPRRTGRPLLVSVAPPKARHAPTEAGRAAWREALGQEGTAPEQEAVTDLLIGLYGNEPARLPAAALHRLKAQAAEGEVDAIARGQSVQVEVYADELRFVADQLGWKDPEQRRARHAELQDLTARLRLEYGPLESVDERTWYAIERSVRVGDSVPRSPSP